jgi:hypothetical protein
LPYQINSANRLQGQHPISRNVQQKYHLPPLLNNKQVMENRVPSLIRTKILTSLKEARFLTISQIATLFYAERADGTPANVIPRKPRPGDDYEMVPGYDSAYQRIRDMRKDGKVKFELYNDDNKVHGLIMLPKEKPPARTNWDHEIDRGDLYVAYQNTGKLMSFDSKWPIEEFRGYAKDHRILFDSRMELNGIEPFFFVEIERDTETWETLEQKVSKYAGLADSMPQHPFYVLFTVQLTYSLDIKKKVDKFKDIIVRHGRQKNFLLGPHFMVVQDPLGYVWDDCRTEKPVSLLDL